MSDSESIIGNNRHRGIAAASVLCLASPAPKVSPADPKGLFLLLEAYECARDAGHNRWDFAVAVDDLWRAGLTTSVLRWLVCKEFAEMVCECVCPCAEMDGSLRQHGVHICKRMSCVLTEAGTSFVRNRFVPPPLLCEPAWQERVCSAVEPSDTSQGKFVVESLMPKWDGDRQRLLLGEFTVKEFKLPAGNQIRVLAAFQEEGWPPHIDDPLPGCPEQDPKRRLHDTINALNRRQKTPLVRFMGDGSGEGVLWERRLPAGRILLFDHSHA